MGYEADLAEDGVEVIERLKTRSYDVILMDIEMPEMDGSDATRTIRAQYGEGGPQIVALTANAMVGDQDRYIREGMNAYVSKPIRIKSLVEALEDCAESLGIRAEGSAVEAPASDPAPPPVATAEAPGILDQGAVAALMELVGNDPEVFTELAQSFLDEGPEVISDMKVAAESGALDKVRRGAHSIKANATDFGALDLAALCRQVENDLRDGEIIDAVAATAEIDIEFAKVSKALSDHLGRY